MRMVISGLVAVGLLAGQVANAEPCAKPADKTALDIAGLKSQLMVTALACEARDKYNSFVTRFQRDLMAQEHALVAYFNRVSGRHGQQDHDGYITSLANAQSEVGIHQGTAFCQHSVGLFDEVLALPQNADLGGFAASKQLTQPIDVVVCQTPATTIRTAQTQRTSASR
jgi:hypothetical protein